MRDEQKHAAYLLSVQADRFIKEGHLNEAYELLQKAAELDATYCVRAQIAPQQEIKKIRRKAN